MALQYGGGKIYDESQEGNTYSLDDIYDASVAGGWGMVERIGTNNNTYILHCPLWIQGNNNLIIGYGKYENLLFDYTESSQVYAIYFVSSGYCRIGYDSESIYSDNTAATIDGYNIQNTTYKRVYLVGDVIVANSMLKNFHYVYVYGNSTNRALVTKCLTNYIHFGFITNEYTDIKDVQLVRGYYGVSVASAAANSVFDNLIIINCYTGLLFSGGSSINVTVRKIKLKNISGNRHTYVNVNYYLGRTINLIDCEADKDKLAFYKGYTFTQYNENYQHLKTTLTAKIHDGSQNVNGATIKLYDKDGNLLFTQTTDENGEYQTEQTYYSKYVFYENNEEIASGEIDLEPFKLVISKAGYETEAIENISVTPGIPTNLNVTLKKAIEAMVTNRGLAIRANKENYGNDRDFALIP